LSLPDLGVEGSELLLGVRGIAFGPLHALRGQPAGVGEGVPVEQVHNGVCRGRALAPDGIELREYEKARGGKVFIRPRVHRGERGGFPGRLAETAPRDLHQMLAGLLARE